MSILIFIVLSNQDKLSRCFEVWLFLKDLLVVYDHLQEIGLGLDQSISHGRIHHHEMHLLMVAVVASSTDIALLALSLFSALVNNHVSEVFH